MDSHRQPDTRDRVFRDFLHGLLFIGLIVGLKVGFEHTKTGAGFEYLTYLWQQEALESRKFSPLPVVVVDMISIPVETVPGVKSLEANDSEPAKATSRRVLLEALHELRAAKVRGVGIDVDFALDGDTYRTPGDPEFFRQCVQLGIPVVLGVFAGQASLGTDAFDKQLAGAIHIPKAEFESYAGSLRHVPYEISVGNSSKARLEALGPKLVRKAPRGPRKEDGRVPRLLHWLVEDFQDVATSESVTTKMLLVDFAPLKRLIAETVRYEKGFARVLENQLDGRFVIFGDTKNTPASDTYSLPGESAGVPGVYLHALSALTEVSGPLLQFTHIGRLVIDGALAAGVLMVVCGFRLYFMGRAKVQFRAFHAELLLTALMVGLVAWMGSYLVKSHRLLWTDYLFVAASLAVHPFISHWLGAAAAKVKSGFTWMFESVALERSEEP